ncbi:hypothetical protein GCM10027168_67880 [Streptomyces capparidis]
MTSYSPASLSPPGDRRARVVCLTVSGVLTLCCAVLLVLVETGWGPLRSADRSLADELHRFAVEHRGWTRANRVLTDWVWDPVTMRLLTALAVVWLVRIRAGRLAVWTAATSLVGLAVQSGVKAAVGRERPSWPDPVDSAHNAAFPSGHAMTAAVTCALLVALFHWLGPAGTRWRAAVWTAAVVSVAGVGFTRVYLGVHWLTDVLSGWLLGVAVVAGCAGLFSPWRFCPETPGACRDVSEGPVNPVAGSGGRAADDGRRGGVAGSGREGAGGGAAEPAAQKNGAEKNGAQKNGAEGNGPEESGAGESGADNKDRTWQ